MGFNLRKKIAAKLVNWLTQEYETLEIPPCDFDRIRYEIRPGDVLLIEGRSRISEVVKAVTQSAWSHSALYIGRLHDIDDPLLRADVVKHLQEDSEEQLLVEGLLGKGTIVSPLSNYKLDHIRICRPGGISRTDAQSVIRYAIERLGTPYDVRHIIDLFRFLYPWSLMPRRWRSSLFADNPNEQTRTICSSLIAEAFSAVRFPILPHLKKDKDKGIQFLQRNPRLFTPRDFDYSPYFEIIKYPIFELSERSLYRHLPWAEDDNSEQVEAKKKFGNAVEEVVEKPGSHKPPKK